MNDPVPAATLPVVPGDVSGAMAMLRACDISIVVWVDDQFAETAWTTEQIMEKVEQIIHTHDPLPLVAARIRDQAGSDFLTELRVQLEQDEDLAMRLTEDLSDAARPGNELSREVRALFIDAIGLDVKRLSHAQWMEQSDSLLAADRGALYLIDNDFTREHRGPDMGRGIISLLLSEATRHRAFCVLFTKSATNEEPVPELTQQSRAFLVLAKSTFHQDQDAKRFVYEMRRILTHLLMLEILAERRTEVQCRMDDGWRAIQQVSVSSLDALLFARPGDEGASELETVGRLWALVGQRGSPSSGAIAMAGMVRAIREADSSGLSGPVRQLPDFVTKLGEQQFFVAGDIVNLQHCQLANGDIFEYEGTQAGFRKQWILLWQPCDLALRPDGRRDTESAWLVPFVTTDEHSLRSDTGRVSLIKSGKCFFIEMHKAENGILEFQLNRARIGSLQVLDLASLSPTGAVCWEETKTLPHLILPGERVRYETVYKRLSQKNVKWPSLWFDKEMIPSVAPKPSIVATYPFRRIKRLREEYAQEALRAMCQMLARPGFNYPLADLIKPPDAPPVS